MDDSIGAGGSRCNAPLCHVTQGPPGERLRGDPFLHCCTQAQLGFVLQRHFAGQSGLWIVRFDPATITGRIDWVQSEPDQDAFPHLFGEIVVALAHVTEVPRRPDAATGNSFP